MGVVVPAMRVGTDEVGGAHAVGVVGPQLVARGLGYAAHVVVNELGLGDDALVIVRIVRTTAGKLAGGVELGSLGGYCSSPSPVVLGEADPRVGGIGWPR